jgi:hypothetical protein
MPGVLSESYSGPPDGSPYVPHWHYKNAPKECPCGHHEGYHDDKGRCVRGAECKCTGLPPECLTPLEDM